MAEFRSTPSALRWTPRLPALVAYEARVEAVHEWPFDAPMLLRFALLALVATGSWVAGAVVERLLGLALG